MGPNVIDPVEAAVEEAVATGMMLDIMVGIPSKTFPSCCLLHVLHFCILQYGLTTQVFSLQVADDELR